MVKLQSQLYVNTGLNRLVHQKSDRTSVSFFNNHTTSILYIGTDRSLSSINGFPIQPQTGYAFNRGLGDQPELEYFGRSSSGLIDVRIMEAEEKKGED